MSKLWTSNYIMPLPWNGMEEYGFMTGSLTAVNSDRKPKTEEPPELVLPCACNGLKAQVDLPPIAKARAENNGTASSRTGESRVISPAIRLPHTVNAGMEKTGTGVGDPVEEREEAAEPGVDLGEEEDTWVRAEPGAGAGMWRRRKRRQRRYPRKTSLSREGRTNTMQTQPDAAGHTPKPPSLFAGQWCDVGVGVKSGGERRRGCGSCFFDGDTDGASSASIRGGERHGCCGGNVWCGELDSGVAGGAGAATARSWHGAAAGWSRCCVCIWSVDGDARMLWGERRGWWGKIERIWACEKLAPELVEVEASVCGGDVRCGGNDRAVHGRWRRRLWRRVGGVEAEIVCEGFTVFEGLKVPNPGGLFAWALFELAPYAGSNAGNALSTGGGRRWRATRAMRVSCSARGTVLQENIRVREMQKEEGKVQRQKCESGVEAEKAQAR
ncbi:hypothetical protein C8R44DRAFT_727279 [Mycena epipterygia]|nr:hypothetical protein C8R44DRAFT_727279 [Mycena epipterygia]